MSDYDVIVIGAGAMGAAACRELARRGVRVLGLEQFDVPHALGSSHGHTRMTRLAYMEHPDYVPLLRRANALWSEIERSAGERLLHMTGGVYAGPDGSEKVEGAVRAAERFDLPHVRLDADGLARRLPAFRFPAGTVGMYEPTAGFLLVERAVAAMAEQALRMGADIRARERVIEWRAEGAGVVVRSTSPSSEREYTARQLVLTAGAWTPRVMHDLGAPLVVTRQVLGWFWPKRPERFELGAHPVWAYSRGQGGPFYGFPMVPGVPGFKLALHEPGEGCDPDRVRREPGPEDERVLREFLESFVPDAAGSLLALRTCMYTNSHDGHFIIDRVPSLGPVTIACGFSGHGFKFAPVVGEILADLALDGGTAHSAAFLGLARFARGQ